MADINDLDRHQGAEIPPLVVGLLDPRAYPHHVQDLKLVQTHVSNVFLTGPYAYKVKKPVDLGFLDFTTLDKRHFYCHEEVRLNRRLTRGMYLGVVPISRRGGEIVVGPGDEVLDYAVQMRQFPQERMMAELLAARRVTSKMVERIARRVATFHAKAETGEAINQFGLPGTVAVNTEENFAQTRDYVDITIPRQWYDFIADYTRKFLSDNEELFQRRIREGRIRDCHGDLRSENICITNHGLYIFDCIEFNQRFRYSDVASDLAFLAMDLDYRRREDLSRVLVNTYEEATGDGDMRHVLDFYKAYRAYVRGKVEGFRINQAGFSPEEKAGAQAVARRYFELAYRYAGRVAVAPTSGGPTLVITTGLMGTGKSTLAGALCRELGMASISSDVVRKGLAGLAPGERRYEDFGQGLYDDAHTARTYDALFAQARSLLAQGQSVVLDASFKSATQRLRALDLAREAGAAFFVVECRLAEPTLSERLQTREAADASVPRKDASDGRLELLPAQKADFDPIAEMPSSQYLLVDTGEPMDVWLPGLCKRIRGR